jgi:hypothetical protein
MKEEIEEAGKSNERGDARKKDQYNPGKPEFETVIDGRTIRGFKFRSEAVAWAVHFGPTFAFYHSGLWEVLGLDDDGFESIKSYTGDPYETRVRDIVLEKYNIRV